MKQDPRTIPGLTAHPFDAHLELLQFFLGDRHVVVERIQGLLNAQRQSIEFLRDRTVLARHFEDCFFSMSGVTSNQSRLRGQLEEAHWKSGFKPRDLPGLHNGLIDPAEMMVRAFHLWQQTRWPGRSGRLRFAHTLFNLYVIRYLELLTMRLWDTPRLTTLARDEAPRLATLARDEVGWSDASERLFHVQGLLDRLRATSPPDQPVFVRDARWLIPLAQSPATDDLGAYFNVAEKIAASLSQPDRIEIHKASVCMAGGHLRSQIRYHALKKNVSLDDRSLILNTRNTNALDFALLIQDLVPLLDAYEGAVSGEDREMRFELADAICQGISPDPELFLNRLELLGAYSMIEHLFLTTDHDGHVVYTPAGTRHVQLIQEYEARIGRVAKTLHADCARFRPVAGGYSPYGVLYGFSTDLIEHMALKTTQPDAMTHLSLEDVFVSQDANGDKLAWVNGWRKLPHLTREVGALFDYPQQFAEEIFERIERALRVRVFADDAHAVAGTGRLFLVAADPPKVHSDAPAVADLPVRYIKSSDKEMVAAGRAEWSEEALLLSDRREGRCLLSYKTAGGWVAISKTVLTEVLGTAADVKIVGLPAEAACTLKLMSPDLVILPAGVPTH